MLEIGPIDVAVGNAVRRHRQRQSWSKAKLAAITGLAMAGVAAIETGRRRLRASEAYEVVRALGITVADLYVDLGRVARTPANDVE